MNVCGMRLNIPPAAVGTAYSFPLPERFAARELIVQCISEWGVVPYYRLAGSPSIVCALKRCDPGPVNVCGLTMNINSQLEVGEATKIPIPVDMFVTGLVSKPDIYAQCEIVNGVRQYVVKDEVSVPCTAFACQPGKIEACNSTVVTFNPANLGEVLHLETVDHRPVKVQCLSTDGKAPRYVAVDCYGQ